MSLIQTVVDNQLFSAGAGLIGVGAGLAALRQGSRHGLQLLRRKYLTTLEIPSHDKSFDWFMAWMTERAMGKSNRHLSVRTNFIQHDNGSISTNFTFLPGHGFHYFRFRNTWFQVERNKDKGSEAYSSFGSQIQTRPRESVTLTGLTQDLDLIKEMLNQCRSHALRMEEGKLVLYTAMGHEWRPFGQPRRRRDLNSVILQDGLSEKILDDVIKFMDPQSGGQWYIKRGIPYRRGYLLYGPPGSGKSSFIYALASHLELNIAILNLAEKWMSDDRLAMLFASIPARTIVLLEDIDSAFLSREQTAGNNLTFSGLLNAMDGVSSSQEGRLIFMTTNHIDKIDPALLRPGRTDMKVYVGDASVEQVRRMFLKFYDDQGGQKYVDQFVSTLLKVLKQNPSSIYEQIQGVSMAQLQGHFVVYRDDPLLAIEKVINFQKQRQN